MTDVLLNQTKTGTVQAEVPAGTGISSQTDAFLIALFCFDSHRVNLTENILQLLTRQITLALKADGCRSRHIVTISG